MAEPDPEVTVIVTMTEQDLHRLTWTVLRRNKRLMVVGIGLGLFTLIMATCSLPVLAGQSTEMLVAAPCLFFVPCLIFVIFPFSIRWSVRKAYRNNPNVQRETTYRFTSQGIASSNEVWRTELTWEAIIEILETRKDFIFFYSKQSALLLPKVAIPSPDERQRLRRLVMACAGERAKLRRENSPEDWSA